MDDIIYKDEDMYGFIYDIVDALKHNLKEAIDNDETDHILLEALEEAIALLKEDDTKFYKVSYNAMGAYVFEEMIVKGEE